MAKIKILTITESGLRKRDGILTVVRDFYSFFEKDRFELDIIAFDHYDMQLVTEFQEIGVNIKYLPSRDTCTLKYVVAFIKLLNECKYDAVYVHGSSAIMSIELYIAKLCGCKKRIAHSHNTTCNHKKVDKLLRPIFYSSYTQALACGRDAGIWLYSGRKFDVIKNGRSVEQYGFNSEKRYRIRQQLGLRKDTIALGHVGRFNSQKNQKFLLGVLKELVAIEGNTKMYFIGDGGLKEEIEQSAHKSGLNKYITFMGAISNVSDILQAMDVMLLPSLYEGLPLVAVEWQIAALPCILSNTITKECAYTDLVHYMALSDGYLAWAKKVLELIQYNRDGIADEVIQKTKENGFDIKENADKLQRYFVEV